MVQKFITIQNFGHNWWWANGILVEYFPGFTTLQLCYKVQELPSKLSVTPEYFSLTDHLHVGCSTTSHRDLKTMNRNANQAPNSFWFMPKDFSPGKWSFFGLASEKKWHSTHECKPLGEWDTVAELMMIKFSESGHPVHCPEERSKAKDVENYQYTSVPMEIRLKLFLAQLILLISSVFTEQSQICVKNTNFCSVRTGRPVLAGQSDPLFVPTSSLMKTPTPSTDDPAQEICCRSTKNERTGYPRISHLEIRIESLNKDNSHSWVRISHGLNKLVTDSSNNKENDNNEQETSEMQFEDFALKTNVLG